MLQDSPEANVMEKKLNPRSAQASGKTLVSDSKRLDVSTSNTKFYGGGGRKWESQSSKGEPSTGKSGPFKKLSPHHRGSYSSVGGSRARNQVAKADEAEVGSASRPGSKKLNLNHLLNFTYDGRGNDSSRSPTSYHRHRNNRNVWSTRVHKYNKEQFLQANCQFVVQEGHDYSIHSADPDLLVDWEWIEQVRVFSHELPSCPICLFPPVAAKITRCGHLYCWPCILHYLALSDKSWRKCPICYEAVSKQHLKSVVAQATPCYKAGDTITMVLMQRERGSVIATPHLHARKSDDQPFYLDDAEQASFSKLVLASNQHVLEEIIQLEQNELETALEENKDRPEVCFIEDAILQLVNRKQTLLKKQIKTEDVAKDLITTSSITDSADLQIINYASAFDEEQNTECENKCLEVERINSSDVHFDEREPQPLPSTGKDRYYFYQSADGQHIYMHALNAHMLTREYGSLENCPCKVEAVVVEKDSISMNEDLRHRLRYLAHLPLTCDFEIVELNLTQPLVSEETLQHFAEEIMKRKRKRNQRAREENKRERQLKAKESGFMSKANKIRLGSLKQFPDCGPHNSSLEDQTFEAANNDLSLLSISSDASGSGPSTGDCAGPSFAQMLREGKAKPEHVNTIVTSPISVVGDTDSDEERMHPTVSYSLSAALQDALDNYFVADTAKDETTVGRKKKLKQNKSKRLLFTTNMIRNK